MIKLILLKAKGFDTSGSLHILVMQRLRHACAGEVIAEAGGDGRGHPLRHVAMRVVAAAAERDLRLWPPAPNPRHEPHPG